MIGYYHASQQGGAHISRGIVCQDSNGVLRLDNGWIIAAIADGVGSAAHSDVGSSLAVTTVLSFLETNLLAIENWNPESLKASLCLAYHRAFYAIKCLALEDGCDVAEYDTTLTVVIYNGQHVIYGHSGDGGVITLNTEGTFSLLTEVQKGDGAANEVIPLRAGPSEWVFGESSDDAICSLLMMTDGMFDVVCPSLLRTEPTPIYVAFIRSLMDRNVRELATTEDFRLFQSKVEAWCKGLAESSCSLDNTPTNIVRITDDITIVGIINSDILPKVKADEYYAEPDWGRLVEKTNLGIYLSNKEANPVSEIPMSESTEESEIKTVSKKVSLHSSSSEGSAASITSSNKKNADENNSSIPNSLEDLDINATSIEDLLINTIQDLSKSIPEKIERVREIFHVKKNE